MKNQETLYYEAAALSENNLSLQHISNDYRKKFWNMQAKFHSLLSNVSTTLPNMVQLLQCANEHPFILIFMPQTLQQSAEFQLKIFVTGVVAGEER